MSVPDGYAISWQNDLARYRANDAWYDLTLACDQTVETAYPLTNMQNKFADTWTAIDMTLETTVVLTDLDSQDSFRTAVCFALHNHNLPAGTTVRLELFDAINQGGTTVYDSDDYAGVGNVENVVPMGADIAGIDPVEGAYEEEGHLKTHYSQVIDYVLHKSFRITITNADGFTDDVILIDKAWLGYAHSFTYGFSNDWELSFPDDSVHQRKPGGGKETVQGVVLRAMTLPFELLSNMEMKVKRYILDRATKGGDLWISADVNDAKGLKYETTSIYRRMNDQSFRAKFFNGNNTSLAVEEN